MWNLGCRKIDEYIFWQVVRFPWRILSFQDSLSSGVSESTVTIAKPLKWALATRHPWLSPRLSTPGSPIQDRADHNTRYVVTSHDGEMMSITVYSQAGIENCHRRNCNPSIRERWLEKLSGLLGFVKFCRFCSCFPETDDECGKLKLMKGLSTCWQLCSHLAPPRNRFRRQTLCENQGKVRRQKKEPILWQISTFMVDSTRRRLSRGGFEVGDEW